MTRLQMKKCNMILTERCKNIALSSGKTDKYVYFTCKETLPAGPSQIINILSLLIFLQKKLLQNQTEKQIEALKALKFYNKTEFKEMEIAFPKNQLNDLIINKLKKIMQLQNNIKIRPSRNVQQREENVTFCFLRNINKGNLPLEDAEEEQTQLAN